MLTLNRLRENGPQLTATPSCHFLALPEHPGEGGNRNGQPFPKKLDPSRVLCYVSGLPRMPIEIESARDRWRAVKTLG